MKNTIVNVHESEFVLLWLKFHVAFYLTGAFSLSLVFWDYLVG